MNLEDAAGEPESINLVTASANFFSVPRCAATAWPYLCRGTEQERPAAKPSSATNCGCVVIATRSGHCRQGDSRARFGGHDCGRLAAIVGGPLVGVGRRLDLSLPLQHRAAARDVVSCTLPLHCGRLRPGVSLAQARVRMETLQHQLACQGSSSVAAGYQVRLTPVMDALAGHVRPIS